MDRKEEIIRLQMDVINQMTQNNLRRITDDLWGVPTLQAGGQPAVKESGATVAPVQGVPASAEKMRGDKRRGLHKDAVSCTFNNERFAPTAFKTAQTETEDEP